jgi:hypothetical protein
MVPASARSCRRSRDTGETTHIRLVQEVRLGEIEAIRGRADQPVRVEIEAFTDPDGREYAPTIRLTLSSASSPDPDADDLTPAEARKLAGALLEAARLAESLAYPGGCGDPAIQRAAARPFSIGLAIANAIYFCTCISKFVRDRRIPSRSGNRAGMPACSRASADLPQPFGSSANSCYVTAV